MKGTWKKTVKTVLCCMVLCLMAAVCLPGIHSEAASKKPVCEKKHTVYVGAYESAYEPMGYSGWIFIKNLASNAKVTKVRSSNENINCWWNGTRKCLVISAGEESIGQKAKITFKVKQNKKTYSLSCQVTCKAEQAFTTLKIGSKNYAKKAKATDGITVNLSDKKYKISVKMASGRKLKSIEREVGMASVKIKNNSKVALQEGDTLKITYTYTKPKYLPKTSEWKNISAEGYLYVYIE